MRRKPALVAVAALLGATCLMGPPAYAETAPDDGEDAIVVATTDTPAEDVADPAPDPVPEPDPEPAAPEPDPEPAAPEADTDPVPEPGSVPEPETDAGDTTATDPAPEETQPVERAAAESTEATDPTPEEEAVVEEATETEEEAPETRATGEKPAITSVSTRACTLVVGVQTGEEPVWIVLEGSSEYAGPQPVRVEPNGAANMAFPITETFAAEANAALITIKLVDADGAFLAGHTWGYDSDLCPTSEEPEPYEGWGIETEYNGRSMTVVVTGGAGDVELVMQTREGDDVQTVPLPAFADGLWVYSFSDTATTFGEPAGGYAYLRAEGAEHVLGGPETSVTEDLWAVGCDVPDDPDDPDDPDNPDDPAIADDPDDSAEPGDAGLGGPEDDAEIAVPTVLLADEITRDVCVVTVPFYPGGEEVASVQIWDDMKQVTEIDVELGTGADSVDWTITEPFGTDSPGVAIVLVDPDGEFIDMVEDWDFPNSTAVAQVCATTKGKADALPKPPPVKKPVRTGLPSTGN